MWWASEYLMDKSRTLYASMEGPLSPKITKSAVAPKKDQASEEDPIQKFNRERNDFIGYLVNHAKMTDEQLQTAAKLFDSILAYSKEPAITMCKNKSGRYAKQHIERIETLITNAMSKKLYSIAFGLELSDLMKSSGDDLAPVIYRFITMASIRSAVTTRCIEIEQKWKFNHRKEALGYDPEIERHLSLYVNLMARKKKEVDLKLAEYKAQADYWEDKRCRLIDTWEEKSKDLKPYFDAMKISADQKELWETEFWDMSPEEKHGFSDDLGVFLSKRSEELMAKKRREFYCSSMPEDIIKKFEKRDLNKEVTDMLEYVDTVKETFRRKTPEQAVSTETAGVEGPTPTTVPVTISF